MLDGSGEVKYQLRPARFSDAKAICAVHHSAVQALKGGFYPLDVLDAWTRAVTEEGFKKTLLTEGVSVWLAQVGSETVGLGVLGKESILAVYVHPAYQGKGLGAAILAHLEAEAQSRGMRCLRLNASLNAATFYKSLGYEVATEADFKLTAEVSMKGMEMEKWLAFQET